MKVDPGGYIPCNPLSNKGLPIVSFFKFNRLRYATPEFYFKTQDEMHKLFKDVPGAIENTRKIAESIDFEIVTVDYHLPNFPIPEKEPDTDPDARSD